MTSRYIPKGAEFVRMDIEARGHTPGPWEAHGRARMSDGGSSTLHAHFGGSIVANRQTIISSSSLLGICGATPKVAEANAKLIAAAPELLEALKEMLASYEAESAINGGWKALNDKTRAVIAKAEGR